MTVMEEGHNAKSCTRNEDIGEEERVYSKEGKEDRKEEKY
jgi:hypothetical protein